MTRAILGPGFIGSPERPEGERIELHPDDAFRVRQYMKRHQALALTADGTTALALRETALVECDLSGCSVSTRIIAKFIPQEWQGGKPVPASAPEDVDITAAVKAMPIDEVRGLIDCSPAANALIDPEDRAHRGPHQVICVDAIARYFGVARLMELTPEIRACAPDPTAKSEEDPHDPLWLLTIGMTDATSYSCRAPDIQEAIRKAGEAFPKAMPVTSAFSIG